MKIWKEKKIKDGKEVTIWCADFTLRGQRYRPREASKRDLDEVIDALRRQARAERYGLPQDSAAVTLAELIAARIRDPERKKHPTYKAMVRVLTDFADFCVVDLTLAELTTTDLRAWLTKRRAHVGPSTHNRELGYISACLRAAGLYFPELEKWSPPRIPWAKEPEGRDRPLALAEAQQLIAHLRAPTKRACDSAVRAAVADLFQLALLTGMRQGEWRLRRWAQVDFAVGLIRLTKTKTGKNRTVEMTAPVRAILARRFCARIGSELIFPGARNPQRPLCATSINGLLKRTATALGIPYGRKVEGGFVFHDTRHTAITNLLQAGHDLATVAEVAGHSKQGMTLRYAHATAASRRRALDSLTEFGNLGADEGAGVPAPPADQPV